MSELEMKMDVVIVGGDGFVGRRLMEVFDQSDTKYVCFDKKLRGDFFCDVRDYSSLFKLPVSDCLINLAAEHHDNVTPISLYDDVNVVGAKNVCAICNEKGINTIVFTSSVAVYGFCDVETDESGDINFFNDYGRTKYEAECVYREWYNQDPDVRSLVIVRPTVIFGEHNRGNVYNLMNQIAKKQFLMVGDGKNVKSMAYVLNVAEFLAFCSKLPGLSVFNYVDKPDLTVGEFVSLVRGILFNKRGLGIRIPRSFAICIGYFFDFLSKVSGKPFILSSVRIRKFVSNTIFSTAVNDNGFRASVSLEEGLRRTIEMEFVTKDSPYNKKNNESSNQC